MTIGMYIGDVASVDMNGRQELRTEQKGPDARIAAEGNHEKEWMICRL